jgi:hypothetical protein
LSWLKDPITKAPSVALTLLVLSTVLMVTGVVMECFTSVRSTHLLDELFGAAIALYGGHMVAFRPAGVDKDIPPSTKITPE